MFFFFLKIFCIGYHVSITFQHAHIRIREFRELLCSSLWSQNCTCLSQLILFHLPYQYFNRVAAPCGDNAVNRFHCSAVTRCCDRASVLGIQNVERIGDSMKLYWSTSRDIKSGCEDCFQETPLVGITTGIYMHIDHGKCDVFHLNARGKCSKRNKPV